MTSAAVKSGVLVDVIGEQLAFEIDPDDAPQTLLGNLVIKPRPHTAIGQLSATTSRPLVLGVQLADPLSGLGFQLCDGGITFGRLFGDPAAAFDLWPVLERSSGAHVYCCGPQGLMDAVRDMSGHWPHSNIHFESFADGSRPRPDDTPFVVQLAKSGRSLEVPVGKSILDVLRESGCNVASSCESGTCGSCRTGLLAGEADHRDMVLIPEEMESQIMVCVSRARSAELVLDL